MKKSPSLSLIRTRPGSLSPLGERPRVRGKNIFRPSKFNSYWFGNFAETIAAWYLRLNFYRILARRFKTKIGEIDIVVKRLNTISFIEVKYRKDSKFLFETVTQMQIKRIKNAAELFLIKHPYYNNCKKNIAVIYMNKYFWPRYRQVILDV